MSDYDFLTAKSIDASGVNIYYSDRKEVSKQISPPLMVSIEQMLYAIKDARVVLETYQEAINNMENLIQKAYQKEFFDGHE